MKYYLITLTLIMAACSAAVEGEDPGFDSETDPADPGCTEIPLDECTVDGDLLHYTGQVIETDDSCEWEYEIQECHWGCELVDEDDDECTPDPCTSGEYICDNAPANDCLVTDTGTEILRYYSTDDNYTECLIDENYNPYCEYSVSNSQECYISCIVQAGDDYCDPGAWDEEFDLETHSCHGPYIQQDIDPGIVVADCQAVGMICEEGGSTTWCE